MKIFISWSAAFLILVFYYAYVQFPMERSFMKGLEYADRNMYVQAIDEFNKVIRVYPDYPPAYLNLALIYSKQRNGPETIVNSQHALRDDIISSEDLSERGFIYYKKRLRGKEIRHYNKIVLSHYLLTAPFSYEKNR